VAHERELQKLGRSLAGGVYSDRVATLARERGIAFSPTKRDLELLQHAGADERAPTRGDSSAADHYSRYNRAGRR
jgi:hypothetical protein